MFAHAVPSSPTVSSSPPPASTTGPSRPSRLRGLSYLRNYTHTHLSLHSQHNSTPPPQRNGLLRSISYPSSSASTATQEPAPPTDNTSRRPSLIGGNSTTTTPAAEEQSEAALLETPGSTTDMARKRSGSSQVTSQAPPTRRGQSVPATEARNGARIPRTTPSNELGVSAPEASTNGDPDGSGLAGLPLDQMPTIKFIPHQDPRAGKPSLSFPATSRTLPHEDCVIRVGRYSERDGQPNPPPNVPSSAPVGFKSKVVSRRHCEFWCSQGQWYIKDVKSSSGTFLNHIRLSQPSVESRPFPVNDGDVVQLGIDFRGGEEMIFRCVKIRIECNRSWQKSLNQFNVTTHKRIRALGKSESKKESDTASTHSSECAICLMSIAPCQSLFVAPCSHVWHYKCIRPMLNDIKTYPQFMCPNCRAMADLEADVDDPLGEWSDADLDVDPPTSSNDPHANSNNLDGTELPILSNHIPHSDQNGTTDGGVVDHALATSSRQLSITNLTHPTDTLSPGACPPDASPLHIDAINEALATEVPRALSHRPIHYTAQRWSAADHDADLEPHYSNARPNGQITPRASALLRTRRRPVPTASGPRGR